MEDTTLEATFNQILDMGVDEIRITRRNGAILVSESYGTQHYGPTVRHGLISLATQKIADRRAHTANQSGVTLAEAE